MYGGLPAWASLDSSFLLKKEGIKYVCDQAKILRAAKAQGSFLSLGHFRVSQSTFEKMQRSLNDIDEEVKKNAQLWDNLVKSEKNLRTWEKTILFQSTAEDRRFVAQRGARLQTDNVGNDFRVAACAESDEAERLELDVPVRTLVYTDDQTLYAKINGTDKLPLSTSSNMLALNLEDVRRLQRPPQAHTTTEADRFATRAFDMALRGGNVDLMHLFNKLKTRAAFETGGDTVSLHAVIPALLDCGATYESTRVFRALPDKRGMVGFKTVLQDALRKAQDGKRRNASRSRTPPTFRDLHEQPTAAPTSSGDPSCKLDTIRRARSRLMRDAHNMARAAHALCNMTEDAEPNDNANLDRQTIEHPHLAAHKTTSGASSVSSVTIADYSVDLKFGWKATTKSAPTEAEMESMRAAITETLAARGIAVHGFLMPDLDSSGKKKSSSRFLFASATKNNILTALLEQPEASFSAGEVPISIKRRRCRES